MEDYKSLKLVIDSFQKDPEDMEKINFSESVKTLNEEIKSYQTENDKMKKDYQICRDHALERIELLKRILKELLGWDIKMKNEFIEFTSTVKVDDESTEEEEPIKFVV